MYNNKVAGKTDDYSGQEKANDVNGAVVDLFGSRQTFRRRVQFSFFHSYAKYYNIVLFWPTTFWPEIMWSRDLLQVRFYVVAVTCITRLAVSSFRDATLLSNRTSYGRYNYLSVIIIYIRDMATPPWPIIMRFIYFALEFIIRHRNDDGGAHAGWQFALFAVAKLNDREVGWTKSN